MELRAMTSTRKSPPSFFTRKRSPARISRAGLAGCPLASILPSSHARAASERVLKNRAAQSHLSILTPVMISLSYHLIVEGAPTGVLRGRYGFWHFACCAKLLETQGLWCCQTCLPSFCRVLPSHRAGFTRSVVQGPSVVGWYPEMRQLPRLWYGFAQAQMPGLSRRDSGFGAPTRGLPWARG